MGHPDPTCLIGNKFIGSRLKPGQHRVLRDKRQLWGQWVYVAALRLEDHSLLVVATQKAPQSAISDYAKRWGIETLFGIFKTRGFCLESTHLTDTERLSKLLALLSIALCWAFLVGDWLHQLKPLSIKKTWSQSQEPLSLWPRLSPKYDAQLGTENR